MSDLLGFHVGWAPDLQSEDTLMLCGVDAPGIANWKIDRKLQSRFVFPQFSRRRRIPGMSDERKPLWPWIVALLMGLPVMYVASYGPRTWYIVRRGQVYGIASMVEAQDLVE